MIEILESNSRYQEYNEYLVNHINNVKRAYRDVLKDVLLTDSDCTIEELTEIETLIDNHDKSKYNEEEYDAYLNYFYPEDGAKKDEDAFDIAWLHHQKSNRHHWQYWILYKDSGESYPLDMPFKYICEMLCDWHSFSYIKPESSAYKWYNENKSKMLLSDNTRTIVEKYIKYFEK